MDVREKLVNLFFEAQQAVSVPCGMDTEKATRYIFEQMAEHLISHGVTVQEWISVNDRLPDDNERVIAYRPNEPETSAYKYCVMWGWSVKSSLKHRGITHWYEMTQPPKGE